MEAPFFQHLREDQDQKTDDSPISDLKKPISLGTTILAVKCKDGIISAADSRTSSGSLIANDYSDKITKITDNVVLLRCGSAASSAFLIKYIKTQCELYKRKHEKTLPIIALVKKISFYLGTYKKLLQSAFIIGGNCRINGFQLFELYRGSYQPMNVAVLGSGSTYILELVLKFYKDDLTIE